MVLVYQFCVLFRVVNWVCFACFLAVLRPVSAPRRWLQRRQIVRPFSRVLVPPLAWGMMWSGSALFGCRLVV